MIINTDEVKNIYISNHFVDMRKSIDGLTLIVHSQFQMNVLDHSLFIFTNKSRNRIKILYYESNGFWLFIKRLEHGKFKIQESQNSPTKVITSCQLNWLLEGLEFDEKIKEKQLLI
ncbi:MAG: IS66 family insertion sequence element accessory protein TnpB [Erysipelotrichales bacterium]|nr:IS66 family insertion sequence element accessory protein TnpB [Erysipelotrichales bacterium]